MKRFSADQSRDRETTNRRGNPPAAIIAPAWALTLVSLITVLSSSTSAQWLELSARPEPPSLGKATYAVAIAHELDSEIAEHDGANEPARAASNVRRLARALLLSKAVDPADESILIVRGMQLHDRRAAVDRALDRIARRSARAGDERLTVVERLREFNDNVERRLSRDALLTGEEVSTLLAPLEEAIAHDSHPNAPQRPSFRDLASRAAAEPAIHAAIAEIADFFERGWAFADLRLRIVQWHALVRESLGHLAAVTDAAWLSETQRREGLERLRQALLTFRDPQRRGEGERLLYALLAEAEYLRAVTTLAQSRSHRVDLDPLRGALNRAHESWGFAAAEVNADRLIERLNWLAVIVERMNRFRALDRDETPFDLRRVRVQIVDAYLAAEGSLLRSLDALIAQRHGAIADPALAALLAEHRRLLGDLERLQSISQWTDSITLIRPASAAKFNDRVRRLANHLGDPVRRVDAAFAMDRIESEIARFWPMPFEDELRLRSRIAERATGGRYRELLDVIDAHRDHWARELAEEGPTLSRPHAQRLEALHQLMSAMNDVAGLLRDEGAARRLNSQDDWWLSAEAAHLAVERLLPPLHRASRAAVEDDEQRLLRELRASEREGALARLIGRRLAERTHAHPPGDLALICRYAVEAIHAHSRQQTDEAREHWRFASRMAAIALNEL